MNPDTKVVRRAVLAFVSLLFLSLASGSVAEAGFKLERSLYRVELTGIYVHDWTSQSKGYPRGDRAWTTEKGEIVSGFHTRGKGILFHGMRFKGEVPSGLGSRFQFYSKSSAVPKAHNRQKITIKQNLIPACGGELGECSGNEPRGVKTISRKCSKPNARRPFSLDYDEKSPLFLRFPFDASNSEFCGKKYPYFASITHMPEKLRVYGGVEAVAKLKRGQKQVLNFNREFGETVDVDTGAVTKLKKSCPEMSGPGVRRCWTIDVTYKVTRVK